MFSAQHYNFIAKRFREQLTPMLEAEERLISRGEFGMLSPRKRALEAARSKSGALVHFAIQLAKHFKKDNEKFDPIKFLDACSPDSEKYPLSELWEP